MEELKMTILEYWSFRNDHSMHGAELAKEESQLDHKIKGIRVEHEYCFIMANNVDGKIKYLTYFLLQYNRHNQAYSDV
jgi:hypothetical protein